MTEHEASDWLHLDWKKMSVRKLKKLIDSGADVHAVDLSKQTALLKAAFNRCKPEILQILLDNGADVHARRNTGETALIIVAKVMNNTDLIKLLLAAGADVNATNHNGKTALYYSCLAYQNDAYDKHLFQIRTLIKAGADLNMKYDSGLSLLKFTGKNSKLIQLLKEAGTPDI